MSIHDALVREYANVFCRQNPADIGTKSHFPVTSGTVARMVSCAPLLALNKLVLDQIWGYSASPCTRNAHKANGQQRGDTKRRPRHPSDMYRVSGPFSRFSSLAPGAPHRPQYSYPPQSRTCTVGTETSTASLTRYRGPPHQVPVLLAVHPSRQ